MQVLDYSAGYPGGQAIARAGFGGVVRYLRKEGASGVRPITTAERADLDGHGLGIALVYQHVDKGRVTQGRAAGVHDAQWALARAAEVGIPVPRCIYFAVDFDADPGSVVAYFAGVSSVLGASRTGGYGGLRVVRRLLDERLISRAWQTTGWSTETVNGRRQVVMEARAALFQRIGTVAVGGIGCDINDVLRPDWGQHNYQEDTDMPWTQADFNTPLFTDNPKTPQEQVIRFRDVMYELRAIMPTVAALNAKVDALAAQVEAAAERGAGKAITDGVVDVAVTIHGNGAAA